MIFSKALVDSLVGRGTRVSVCFCKAAEEAVRVLQKQNGM